MEPAVPPSSPPPPDADANGKAPDQPQTLELADELFNKGVKAVKDEDYVDAVDCFSRALEIRVAHYGELAPECAVSYYKYGSALLYKAQEEADPLGNVPKNGPIKSGKDKSSKAVGDCEGSEPNASSRYHEGEEGTADKDEEDDNEGSDADGDCNDEGLAEADEDDSDLDLAWKMLDVARAIVEKTDEDTLDKVNIYAALGEVSMEREDFETSLNDYLKALSILELLVEPDNRRIIELNFRICLVLEVWSKVEEAVPYCKKAIMLCESRLKHLGEDVKPTSLPDIDVNGNNDSGTGGNQASEKCIPDPPNNEDEKEVLSGILSELERKLEDLQHVLSNPNPIISEIIKMAAAKSASAVNNRFNGESSSASASSSSLQTGVVNGCFDPPTVSTSASSASSVTHLGVVGRGVKRASLNPISAEPSTKKVSFGSSEVDAGSVSDGSNQHTETANN